MAILSSTGKVDFNRTAAPPSIGMSTDGVSRLAGVFERQLADGLHPGAQLVLLRHGQVLLDRAAGWADVRARRPVTPETTFLTFSVTKAFTGVCVHRLIELGELEWDAPVARYWPDFGRFGKREATIRHVFLHQAGIPQRGLAFQVLFSKNWERVTRYVASSRAEFPPGSKTAYHSVSYGTILGEVIRRVAGIPVEEYLKHAFLEPMGLKQTRLGLPDGEVDRSAVLYNGCADQRLVVWAFNLPFVRRSAMPAATLHSNARELAIFYQMLLNGGEYNGKRYLHPETVTAATSLGYEGHDEVIGRPMRWAHGFHLGGLQRLDPAFGDGMGKGSSVNTFGHFGQRTCMVWADPEADLVLAFTCNRLLSREGNLGRWQEISNAVWDALD